MFKTKCPKCGLTNINTVKGKKLNHSFKQFFAIMFFWPALFFTKKPKDLLVCRDCGFSWEKR